MNDRLKAAFSDIRADEELKRKTEAYIARRVRHRGALRLRRLAPVMACLALIFMGWGGLRLWFTPTSVISIDINPSLELGVNRFDRVVSVTGYNDDGRALAESLSLRFLHYETALDQVLASDVVADCLTRNELLSIAVAGKDDAQCRRMLSHAEACTSGHQNADCHSASMEEMTSAHDMGLSCGRYAAFLELQALDPSITPDQVQNMTMREIRALITALSEGDESAAPAATPAAGTQTGHHGEGHGCGAHHGWE